jgi:hypothetical protein
MVALERVRCAYFSPLPQGRRRADRVSPSTKGYALDDTKLVSKACVDCDLLAVCSFPPLPCFSPPSGTSHIPPGQLNPRHAFLPLSVDMFAQPYFKLPLYSLKLSDPGRLLDAAGRLLPGVRGVWKRRWIYIYHGRLYLQRDMKVSSSDTSPPLGRILVVLKWGG